MSCFAGIVAPSLSPADTRWVEDAAAFMMARAPDGGAFWHNGRAGLSHALLRTGAHDARAQPLSIDGVWLAGDIRFDARDELVRDLRALGRTARVAVDDSELALQAYHAWGDDCVAHFIGDFAFALWDARRGRLLCARDQCSVVPFYYAAVGERLLVGNVLDSLLLHEAVPDGLNDDTVADILLRGWGGDSAATVYEAIRRLPGAHVLTWANGRSDVRRYWKLPEEVPLLTVPRPEEYIARFRGIFERAVADRAETASLTVPLSGGLDSTSIAAVTRRANGGSPEMLAITLVVKDLEGDPEGPLAKQVADSLGIPLEVMSAADYPLRDPLAPPEVVPPEPWPYIRSDLEVRMLRRATAHGRVVLSGLGGDPLFTFVPWYWARWLAKARIGRLSRHVLQHLRHYGRPPAPGLRSSLRVYRSRRPPQARPHWLNAEFVARTAARREEVLLRWPLPADARAMLDVPMWAAILGGGHHDTHASAVSFRYPFFDVRLIEFVLSLPPVPWHLSKKILRDSMDGLLPASVLRRPKRPLPTAIARDLNLKAFDPRTLSLISQAPALDKYLERKGLVDAIRAAERSGNPGLRYLHFSVGFAFWMNHRRQSVAGKQTHERAPKPVRLGVNGS